MNWIKIFWWALWYEKHVNILKSNFLYMSLNIISIILSMKTVQKILSYIFVNGGIFSISKWCKQGLLEKICLKILWFCLTCATHGFAWQECGTVFFSIVLASLERICREPSTPAPSFTSTHIRFVSLLKRFQRNTRYCTNLEILLQMNK